MLTKIAPFQSLVKNVRSCTNCGSFNCKQFCLCQPCWSFLKNRESDLVFSHLDRRAKARLEIKSLFEWEPDENRPLSLLLQTLKGGPFPSDFDVIAQEFHRRFHLSNKCTKPLVLVPAPPRGNQRDHAQCWAEALQRTFGGAIVNGLRRIGPQEQKELSRNDRYRLRLEGIEKFTGFDQQVVFVDDVVTTGATVFAAYKALGLPPYFQAWTIAYRIQKRRSCDSMPRLL